MVQHGVERYRAAQDTAVAGDRTSETSAGSRLMRSYVLQISDHLKVYLAGKHPEGRKRGKYAKLLDAVDTDKIAMLALKAVIASMFQPQSLQTVCISIGRVIEDEAHFMKFALENKAYYEEIIRKFEARGTKSYRHKRRNLVHAAGERNEATQNPIHWTAWQKVDHFGVGSLVVGLMLEVCDLVEKKTTSLAKGRKEVMVIPSEACVAWVMNHNEVMEVASPDRMPCVVPPQDWVDTLDGGYYSPALRSRTPFVKSRGAANSGPGVDLLRNAEMPRVLQAANALQRTAWTLNTRVLETMREVWHLNLGYGMPQSRPYEPPTCPLAADVDPRSLEADDPVYVTFKDWKAEAAEMHGLERERIAKNRAVVRTIRTATALEDYSRFHYVYQCCFRGRLYSATTGLSPQGTDQGKGLLQFADGKPLGERGLYWLKVHGANKYGMDKVTYDDRVAWVDEHHVNWCAVATDPVANATYWKDADKPYQFLAFCFEYAQACVEGTDFVSYLPIAKDGSCNGLQHFSAMLRDPLGGAAVNLVPNDVPADIYQDVGDVSTDKLRTLRGVNDEQHAGAANWLALFKEHCGKEAMPRKLPKPPVMTMPYGSTRQACTQSIFKWTQDTAPEFFQKSTGFRHAMYLSPVVWESIGEVVVAARLAMDWMQDCASILAKAGHALQYTSPLGFPVYQATHSYTTRCIETQIGGRLQVRIAEDTDKLSARKQRQGSSPNMNHHADACHLHMVVTAAEDQGVTSFAMVHDDFGTHACDIDILDAVIREEFVKLHHENDLLADFKRVHEERHGITLPDLPAKGTLDLHAVLNSPYFFG
jgi:DNA-directed RNA polymerase